MTIDRGARQAHVGARLLELTPMEYDLLAYFVSRPGHVFSRDELLRAVWESTAEWQQPATVTEHIRRLRVKIETEPRRPRILRTVRGAGYRLDIPEDPTDGASDIDTTFPPGTLIHVDRHVGRPDPAEIVLYELDDETELVGHRIPGFTRRTIWVHPAP